MSTTRGAAPTTYPAPLVDIQASDKAQGIRTSLQLTVYGEAVKRIAGEHLTEQQVTAVNELLQDELRRLSIDMHDEVYVAIQNVLAASKAEGEPAPKLQIGGVVVTYKPGALHPIGTRVQKNGDDTEFEVVYSGTVPGNSDTWYVLRSLQGDGARTLYREAGIRPLPMPEGGAA